MILFFSSAFPMSVTAVFCALAMGVFVPEMKLAQIYSGFGGSSIVMVAGMMIVGDALFQTGIAKRVGTKICQYKIAQNEKMFIVLVVIICTVMSAFLSNSGCIAMWMPIIAAVAAGSNGKVRSKMVIMPAGIACIIGGGSTLTGSVSQVAANAVLMGTPGYSAGMGVFDMTRVMWPICLIQIAFWLTFGYNILVWALKPGSPDFDKNNSFANASADLTDDEFVGIPAWKGNVSITVLILCIIGFILSGQPVFNKFLNIANVAMIGSFILFVTKTIPLKKTLGKLDWDILIMIGAVTALGTGIDVSGAGKVIANSILNNAFSGANTSIPLIMTVLIILSSVLTLFMQNSSVAAVLSPIFIPMAKTLGISPLPFIILIGATTNLAIASHIGTAVNMQILPAGYKPIDYVKIGGPLFIIMVAVLCIISPMILL
jgi:Di- and tricarboxylate transporters